MCRKSSAAVTETNENVSKFFLEVINQILKGREEERVNEMIIK